MNIKVNIDRVNWAIHLKFLKIIVKNANRHAWIVLLLLGQFTIPMVLITLCWGILAGIGANINQYWITSSAPEAPEFANGIFFTAGNLGTTISTPICGMFISGMGTQYLVLGGLVFLILSIILVLLRVYTTSQSY